MEEKQPTSARGEDMSMDIDSDSDTGKDDSRAVAGSMLTNDSMDVSESAVDSSLPLSGTLTTEPKPPAKTSIHRPIAQGIITSGTSQPESHLWAFNGKAPAPQDTATVGPAAQQPTRSQNERCSAVFAQQVRRAQPPFPSSFAQPCSAAQVSPTVKNELLRMSAGHATDRLSQLPLELFFNVLCQLDAVDLTRIAQ
ncbi:hypothetical protein BGX31_011719, partial [Mortierella sp. GBA43]